MPQSCAMPMQRRDAITKAPTGGDGNAGEGDGRCICEGGGVGVGECDENVGVGDGGGAGEDDGNVGESNDGCVGEICAVAARARQEVAPQELRCHRLAVTEDEARRESRTDDESDGGGVSDGGCNVGEGEGGGVGEGDGGGTGECGGNTGEVDGGGVGENDGNAGESDGGSVSGPGRRQRRGCRCRPRYRRRCALGHAA